jgi:hypothetical protein
VGRRFIREEWVSTFFLRLQPHHFSVWLAVWEQNCIELLPHEEAMELIQLAHNIGDDLRRMAARPRG